MFVTGPQFLDGILYECDYSAKEAILLENYDDIEEEVYPYTQTNFVVPATITLTGVSAAMGAILPPLRLPCRWWSWANAP